MKKIYLILGFLFLVGCSTAPDFTPTPSSETPEEELTFQPLTRHFVENAEQRMAICNDGSPAVYYMSEGAGEGKDNWLVYLQGGGYCENEEDCMARAKESPKLVSTERRAEQVNVGGIFLRDPELNPDFYNMTQVYVSYCSSDLWAGDTEHEVNGETWQFRGTHIVKAVIEDLNMEDTELLLFAGSSIGAAGMVNNADRVAAMIPDSVEMKAIVDGLWWPIVEPFDGDPYKTNAADEANMEYLNLQVDESCVAENGNVPDYNCSIPTEVADYLSMPLFVYVDRLDPVYLERLGIDNIRAPEAADYMAEFSEESLEMIESADAIFSTNMVNHTILHITDKFFHTEVDGHTLPEILANWVFEKDGPIKVIDDE